MAKTIINKLITAYSNGILIPYQAMRASDESGVPFYVICAFLEQESSGGQNVFGHDRSIYSGAGRVTKKKYLAYKEQRDATRPRKMQGVGPMQLTWWTYQDEADVLGGCWKPRYNVLTGANILARLKTEENTWYDVAVKYNGKVSYANDIQGKFDKWRALLA